MRRIPVLVPALAAALALCAPAGARAATGVPNLSDEEATFCADELEVLERRQEVFERQGLSAAEIARKNDAQLRLVNDCRERFRAEQRRAAEQKQDIEEAHRRAGPNATEKERERAWREVRRERLAAKPPSQLTKEEKAELAAGTPDELAATHSTRDGAHAQDAAFMRMVHSAMACYHTDRKAELQGQIASEESFMKLGTGDRQRLYALRSELHQSEEVLARTREATGGRPLEKCSNPTVALISHCMGVRLQEKRPESACESEEIQQYVRFVR
jgi:hypothetical protein